MNDFIKRDTILNHINCQKNIFCEADVLTNEAAVEIFFVNRLIKALGYEDRHIKTKESIEQFLIAKGSKKINYKPDYILLKKNNPLIIIDAKSPEESIDDWKEQCAHYCLVMNRSGCDIKFFILTNGYKTKLYKWDSDNVLVEISFNEFFLGSNKYELLHKIINFETIDKDNKENDDKLDTDIIELKKISKEEAQKLFVSCHKLIWNQEKRSPNSAFIEFVKLIFVKLYNDKRLHDNITNNDNSIIKVKKSENIFSTYWIESREGETSNPINDIQFKNLMESLQDEVTKNHKKTIFYDGDKIELKPTTIKAVVKKLEKVDLFGIDEDLNGRLFETFLNATMRGEALGQYFTPRSIVLLGTLIADLSVSEKHIDKVLDGSCGSGGFLIEALTIMRNKVRGNSSYSKEIKSKLISRISNESLFGIDAAIEPNLAKIARINMYLHGDGGSHIYCADGLAKNTKIDKTDSTIVKSELIDMQKHIARSSFDVVLTNPPFSMWYDANDDVQKEVIQDYKLLVINEETNKKRNRLRTSAMFIERYNDLLKKDGKLISVIDETILSSSDYSYVRDYIRKYFIIKAIISLHGDAFQMSSARVKTALVYLQKKENITDEQPACFMYSSVYLGVDDMPITTAPNKILDARKKASEEIDIILNSFSEFQSGGKGNYYVDASRLNDRLDVKSCINLQGRYVDKWVSNGFSIDTIGNLCQLIEDNNRIIQPKKDYPDEKFRILTITYEGKCKADEERYGKHINYSKMIVCKEGDLIFSEYNAFQGAIGYITKDFDGSLASGSYTVVRCKNIETALYLWAILRTTEIRTDLLTSAVGMGRQTISWENIKNIKIPIPDENEVKKIVDKILQTWEAEKMILQNYEEINNLLHNNFDVESEESKIRFLQNKPPK